LVISLQDAPKGPQHRRIVVDDQHHGRLSYVHLGDGTLFFLAAVRNRQRQGGGSNGRGRNGRGRRLGGNAAHGLAHRHGSDGAAGHARQLLTLGHGTPDPLQRVLVALREQRHLDQGFLAAE
jgi:hypothetical protein